MGRTIQKKKILNHTQDFTFSKPISHSWWFGARDTYLPSGIRTAAVPYGSTPASLQIHAVWAEPYTLPYVCLYHVYVPAVHSCSNKLYTILGDRHATIKMNVQCEHEPNRSNDDTFDTNPLLFIQTTLRTI